MPDRDALATAFLEATAWAGAQHAPLAGDASNRRYERLFDPKSGKTAVLMDAAPDRGEDVRPFVRVAEYLESVNLSAPMIFAADTDWGFLLIEDLGDALFARVVAANPELEHCLYSAATDVLLALRRAPLPDLLLFDSEKMTDAAALVFDTYQQPILGNTEGAQYFREVFPSILAGVQSEKPVPILRDYHAENLLWLPDRQGIARVGLLDFQDAMLAHPAYDLVSLLQDARRDVPKTIETAMIERYVKQSGVDHHTFQTAYAILGVQRNLRILAVFARLGTEYGKPQYLSQIPRVWSHLMRDLEHPALEPVAGLLTQVLPQPDSVNLLRLTSP